MSNTQTGWGVLDWREHPMFNPAATPVIPLKLASVEQATTTLPDLKSELERRKDDLEGWREYEEQVGGQAIYRGSKVQRKTRR